MAVVNTFFQEKRKAEDHLQKWPGPKSNRFYNDQEGRLEDVLGLQGNSRGRGSAPTRAGLRSG